MTRLRLASAMVLALAASRAAAFHSGGVGACEGCHTMHVRPDGVASGSYLLRGSDASSTCLTCHGGATAGSYQVFTTTMAPGFPPRNYTPGGDFGWLLKSYSWMGASGLESSQGDGHGHNISAADYGLYPDAFHPTAPGGSYPSNQLTCISCHDPHGRFRFNVDGSAGTTGYPIASTGSYGGTLLQQPTAAGSVGAYRLLAGSGYVPKSAGAVVPLSANPPVALAPQDYNRSERMTDVRVAYGSGMSEWCQSCHSAMHTPNPFNTTSTLKHPVGAAARLNVGGESAIYNQYIRSGVLTGVQTSSYTSLVPYEEGTTDRSSLSPHAVSDGSATAGPFTGQENVMCLSCHRAHASGWDHATRWNMPASGTIVFGGSWPGIDSIGDASLPANAQGRTKAESQAAMYDRDPTAYSPYQKVLCNKCHGQG